MNQKIVIGISSITILTLIYQYIKNIFNPKNKKILEGQENVNRLNNLPVSINNNNNNNNTDNLLTELITTMNSQAEKLDKIYEEISEFNHIYQERLFEELMPSQMTKTILHLSSIDHSSDGLGSYVFDLASNDNSGLRKLNNIINLRLLSVQIPYIPHNIYEGDNNNNKLKFIELNEITIEEGKYDIYSLINKINNLLTDILFNFNKTKHTISIKNNTGSSITIDTSYVLFKRLGFHEQITITGGGEYISEHIPDISVHYIDIISPDIHPRSATLTNNHSTILKRIPFTGSMGDLIYYESNHSDYISQELFIPDLSSNISTFTLNLTRHDGTPYDLKKLHFDLKIEVTELIEPTLLTELKSHMERDRAKFLEKDNTL